MFDCFFKTGHAVGLGDMLVKERPELLPNWENQKSDFSSWRDYWARRIEYEIVRDENGKLIQSEVERLEPFVREKNLNAGEEAGKLMALNRHEELLPVILRANQCPPNDFPAS